MKKNVILSVFCGMTLFSASAFAQQAPSMEGSLASMNKTEVGDCLRLFDQLSVKQQGKGTEYRLIGTRTGELAQLIDSNKIWWAHEFGSLPIPPMISENFLNSDYGFTNVFFDSVIKYVPDPQNPGSLRVRDMKGYSFNSDWQLTQYYQSVFGYVNRYLYSYNGSKQLVGFDSEVMSGGNWVAQQREINYYSGNTALTVGMNWNANTTSWDTTFKKYIWYDANSRLDSNYLMKYANGQWNLFSAQAYDYASDGQITRAANYGYDLVNKVFNPSNLSLSTYNVGGKLTSKVNYSGSSLVLSSRELHHYSGLLLDSIAIKSWDAGNAIWNDVSNTIFSYTAGLLTKKEAFVVTNGKLTPFNKLEFTSDCNQNISSSAFFLWNASGQKYMAGVKHYYTYESYQKTGVGLMDIEKNAIKVYPNPSNGVFHLEVPFEGRGSYQVMSLDGKEVAAAKIGAMEERILLMDLELNTGVYFIQLKDENDRIFSTKISIH